MTLETQTLVSDTERLARATLLHVTEPASPSVVLAVRRYGVEHVAAAVAADDSLGGALSDGVRSRWSDGCGERDLERITALGGRLLCPGDEEWPAPLDDLASVNRESFGLWVLGEGRLDRAAERAVAIVGTRTATPYGTRVAEDLASGLAEHEFAIISGLAAGIDAAAHRGCLAAAGVTVAVLACGVNKTYPPEHGDLARSILARGLLVSEHPPGAAPQRLRFLVRNRIIAGLAAGTVMVEAGFRSGARSTATHAEALLRHVMAVPGPVTSSVSAGCRQLLRDRPGTVLVTRIEDVLEVCGDTGDVPDWVRGPVRRRDRLGPVVSRVLDAVPVRSPQPVAAIARVAGMGQQDVDASLRALQVQGLVTIDGDGWVMTRLGRAERHSAASTPRQPRSTWGRSERCLSRLIRLIRLIRFVPLVPGVAG